MRWHAGRLLARHAKIIVALAVALTVALAGVGQSTEESLRLMRDGFHDRAASGRVVLVEIDAQSLRAVGQWPWPRKLHAALLDRLRTSGANTIAYDVDFSARSNAADDDAFADALKRAQGSVILPTFRQASSSSGNGVTENLPITPLRDHAFLASVNVTTEHDGQLKRFEYGTVTAGVARPSVAAMLANVSGRIGNAFRIDTSINPQTIPRVSAIAVLEGRFGGAALHGKAVLIGGTAIEMGDRYPVPGHGVLPGVVAQALAAETLIAGTGGAGFGILPALLIATILVALYPRVSRLQFQVRAIAACAIALVPLLLETVRLPTIDIVPALLLLAVEWLWTAISDFWTALQRERRTDRASGLPNQRALEASVTGTTEVAIVTLRMMRFEEMEMVLDEATRAHLTKRVVDRLLVGFPNAIIHIVAPGVFAWTDTGDIITLSDRIEGAAALFRAPLAVGERSMLITPTFGVCMGSGRDTAQLVRQAGLAARIAQEQGQRWGIHSDASANQAERSLALLADVDTAIDDGSIYIVCQPKWSLARETVCGAEALVRWQHPRLGPISPDSFIPLLEATGNIARLTLWVLDSCIDQLMQWHTAGSEIGLAVNVSAVLLNDPHFVQQLEQRIQNAPSVRRRLTLEITESAAVETVATAITVLSTARALGVRVSIDDYGTGHATLGYLKSFPADEIKIDKSFITSMLDNVSDQILVRSTIEMARELGFLVVAEGVEDAGTLAKLADFGCDIAQGYVISRPVETAEFTARWVDDTRRARIAA